MITRIRQVIKVGGIVFKMSPGIFSLLYRDRQHFDGGKGSIL